MLLNIVTDEELLTSQIIKTILLCITGAGTIYNLIRVIRTRSKMIRIINSIILIILSVANFFIIREYRLERSLLRNPEYIEGTTLGFCTVFARGQGIEFEYEVNGKKIRGCNTFHPVSKDSIKVPGGKYIVRYSLNFPYAGRMNFRRESE